MKKNLRKILPVLIVLILFGCRNTTENKLPEGTDVLHRNENNLTDLIIYDIFSPPVAARIYAYTSLAAHEALRHIDASEPSIVAKLKGFLEMPQPDKNKKYNYVLAASKAFYTVMRNLTFSKDTITKYEENTYAPFKSALSKEEYDSSIAFGEAVAAGIMKRVASDHYKETRAMAKYYGSKDDGKWCPTAPDYLDGVEPYWNTLKPLILDSAREFDPGPPPPFSKDTSSEFYKMNKEVYDVGKNLTKEEKDIARFWDDNPFVTEHSGHLMFGTKKQTPGGHWMGITTIACKQNKADVLKTARTYALAAIGLHEAFISCFDTKYKYAYVRPITVINNLIDKSWDAYLQTPPFPEYTSGHSTITASVATILTHLYGDNIPFEDTSDLRYIGMQRHFDSFMQAASECSVSRLYGGIHYRLSVNIGAECGRKIGEFVIQKLSPVN